MSFSRELKSAVPTQWNSAHSIYISLDKVHYRCYESKTKTHFYLFIQGFFRKAWVLTGPNNTKDKSKVIRRISTKYAASA